MTTDLAPTRFGVFLAPYHPDDEHPTLLLRRDIELAQHLERLDYDELWIGEHHSGAYELIGSPEVFIAAAAERTSRIRLGTGVISLPYHHPFMVADRIAQLDHQTGGRVICGVGPGQLPSDAYMLGIDVAKQRTMMNESLDVLLPLLRGEVVTHKTDWFELREARLQLGPYSKPRVEMAVAAAISPSGPRAAGKYGIGMLSMAATNPDGFSALPNHWGACEQLAREHRQAVDRANWRLVAPMHLAETREQAVADMEFGLLKLVRYLEKLGGAPLPYGVSVEAAIEQWEHHGLTVFGTAVIGTPDDAIAQIERLVKQSDGFGTFLLLAHDCADPDRTKKSYELFARYVIPEIGRLNANRHASLQWFEQNSTYIVGELRGALGKAIAEHEDERARRGGEGVAWADQTNLLVGSDEE
ncbi:MAG: LLM class flavin-dependent oxidoreductase [Candidatus Binatia bacterium]